MLPNYRRCLSCRKVASKETFWRIVRVYPSRQVQLDQGMGRSAYLCPDPDCLRLAQQKNRLGRALKAYVSEQIYQTLWERLANPYNSGHPQALRLKICVRDDLDHSQPPESKEPHR